MDRAGDDRRAGGVLVTLACTVQFMVVLDVSVVNVALPSIRTSLGFTGAGLPWVANAYALAFAGLLLPGGRLADLYGLRRTVVSGLALFTAASVAGGVAGTPGMLIAARAGQGLGAAVLAPASLTVITATMPDGARRIRALAAWTAVALAGGAAGNIVGGLLTEALTWRAILLVNAPIGAAALYAAARHLPGPHGPAGTGRLDAPGALTATLSLVLLTYGVTHAGSGGRGAAGTVTALAAGGALIAAFAVIEARWARTPLVPPVLFRSRAIAVGNALMLTAGACFQAPMWYFLTLYMQNVLHYDALRTGLAFLPHTLGTMIVALRVTPPLMRRYGARTLVVAGAVVAATGFAWQGRIGPDSGYVAGILGPAIAISIGGGLLNTPLTGIVTADVDPAYAGAASGLMNTAKQIGGALGLAALTTITIGSAGGADPAALARGFTWMAVALAALAAGALLLPGRRAAQVADASERAED